MVSTASYIQRSSKTADGDEQELIAQLEAARAERLRVRKELDQNKSGASDELRNRYEQTKERHRDVGSRLEESRSSRSENQQDGNRRTPLTVYLEKRRFARDFPEDKQTLSSYQTYDQRGFRGVLSVSGLNLVGQNVDLHL